MNLNNDLSLRVVLRSTELPWQPSPVESVQRRLLARDGGEEARATSIVRYAPGAKFPSHAHPQGEEIVVLEGEFADEHGIYPAGTYLKNPPGTSHAPRSDVGCTLFVKLRHLNELDLEQQVIRPMDQHWRPGLVSGLEVVSLSEFGATHTALVRWAPGTFFNKHHHFGGEEIFVLQGTFQDEYGSYPSGTWIRSPPHELPPTLLRVRLPDLRQGWALALMKSTCRSLAIGDVCLLMTLITTDHVRRQ